MLLQIDAAIQRKAERDRGGGAYEDPIARLKHYADTTG